MGRCRKIARDGKFSCAGEHVLERMGVDAGATRKLGEVIMGVHWLRRALELVRAMLPLWELDGRSASPGEALPDDVEPGLGISSRMGRNVQREEACRGARQSSGGA